MQPGERTPARAATSRADLGLSTNINVQEAKEFRVVIELKDLSEESKLSLRPGMSATAVITTKTEKNVVSVPLQAVIEKKTRRSTFADHSGRRGKCADTR